MRIAIIGTGNVGSAIAQGLRDKGHDVVLGTRRSGEPEMQALADRMRARLAAPADAAKEAEVVILALPWAGAEAAIAALGDLSGKTVIDCMNPLAVIDGALSLAVGHSICGGEMVQSWLPGARVVKTLNQVGAEIMAGSGDLPHRPVQFLAGDDGLAKGQVAGLLQDMGFEPLDAGDLAKARLLEPFAMVWINQALLRGKGRNWAFAAVSAAQS